MGVQIASAKIQIVRLHILRWFSFDRSLFDRRKCALQLSHDGLGELTLQRKQVINRALIVLRPDLRVSSGIDEPHINSNPLAGSLYGSFKHTRNSQGSADLARILFGSPVMFNSRSANNLQVRDLCQVRQYVILHPINEVSIVLVIIESIERQDGNTLSVDQRGGVLRGSHCVRSCCSLGLTTNNAPQTTRTTMVPMATGRLTL